MSRRSTDVGPNGSSLQQQLDSWTQELAVIEREKAELESSSSEAAADRRRRRRSGSGSNSRNSRTNSQRNSPLRYTLQLNDGEEEFTQQDNIQAPPSTAQPAPPPTAYSQSAAPPSTAIAAGRAPMHGINQGDLALGLAAAALAGDEDVVISPDPSPRAAPNARHYSESENMLRLDDSPPSTAQGHGSHHSHPHPPPVSHHEDSHERRSSGRSSRRSSGRGGEVVPPLAFPTGLHSANHHALPLDTLTVSAAQAVQDTDRYASNSHAPPPTAAQHRSSSGSNVHIPALNGLSLPGQQQSRPTSSSNSTGMSNHPVLSHPSIGLGVLIDPPSVGASSKSKRRSSGTLHGLLPSLDPAVIRSVSSGSSLPRTPGSGGDGDLSSGGGIRSTNVRSQAGSGSCTPQLRARKVLPQSLAPLEHTPVHTATVDVDDASTLDLSALQTSISSVYNSVPAAGGSLHPPERSGLSSLAQARAQRRRSVPGLAGIEGLSGPGTGDHSPLPADGPVRARGMLQPLQSRASSTTAPEEANGHATHAPSSASSNPRRRSDRDDATPSADGIGHSPSFPSTNVTGSPNRLQRPTTPYSNAASFEAISKRRSLPPLGLANISEQLNATAK